MAKYPKVEKGFARLSQDDSLRNATIQLVTAALFSAGVLLTGNTLAEAKPTSAATLSPSPTQGSAITFMPVSKQGTMVLTGHESHSSHASHASHHSHYSSR
jgi:hypothetical protein